jgi:hypothetical protein
MEETPDDLLQRLAASPDHTYPLEVLTKIRARLPEMTPVMLAELEEIHRFPDDYSCDGLELITMF